MPIGPTIACSVRADPAVLLHLPGRLAHRLDHQRDRAPVAVEVGDRERDALAVLVRHDDDELAGLRRLRHQRMADLQQVGDVEKSSRATISKFDMTSLRRASAAGCAVTTSECSAAHADGRGDSGDSSRLRRPNCSGHGCVDATPAWYVGEQMRQTGFHRSTSQLQDAIRGRALAGRAARGPRVRVERCAARVQLPILREPSRST